MTYDFHLFKNKRLQEARLQILTKVISKREVENEAVNNERIERIWKRKLQEREAMMEKIERRRQKGNYQKYAPAIFLKW
jgi:hypothetical protein